MSKRHVTLEPKAMWDLCIILDTVQGRVKLRRREETECQTVVIINIVTGHRVLVDKDNVRIHVLYLEQTMPEGWRL